VSHLCVKREYWMSNDPRETDAGAEPRTTHRKRAICSDSETETFLTSVSYQPPKKSTPPFCR
jgi:hypothetical protein